MLFVFLIEYHDTYKNNKKKSWRGTHTGETRKTRKRKAGGGLHRRTYKNKKKKSWRGLQRGTYQNKKKKTLRGTHIGGPIKRRKRNAGGGLTLGDQ